MAFRTMQFCKYMAGFFMQNLALPEKLRTKFTPLVGNLIELKLSSGDTWRVGLIKSGRKLVLEPGWNDFVRANKISQNNLLFFKYVGICKFEIVIFDSIGYEKKNGSDQIVTESESSQSEPIGCEKKNGSDQIVTESESSRSEPIGYEKKNGSDQIVTESESSRSEPIGCEKKTGSDHIVTESESSRSESAGDVISMEEESFSATETPPLKKPPSKNPKKNKKRIIRACEITRGLKLTEEQTEKAEQLAREVQAGNPSFLQVLKPINLSPRFILRVPKKFGITHLPKKNWDFNFRFWQKEKKTWKVWYGCYSLHRRELRWKKFTTENNLQKGDICLFELVKATKQITFIVHASRSF